MSDEDRTRRLEPWEESTRRVTPEELERTRAMGSGSPWDPTRPGGRPDELDRTRRLRPEEMDPPPTISLDDPYTADPGTQVLDDRYYDGDRRDAPGAGAPGGPVLAGDEERHPRWGLPLVTGVLGLIAGLILALLLAGGQQGDTVPRRTLEEAQAAAAAALQDAQATISQRDAEIAALQQQIAQLDVDQDAAAGAEQAALDARRQALDEREAALNAREQALNERDQAQDPNGPLPDVDLPGVDLPDVSLPDIDIPEEEARNLLERFMDLFRGDSSAG
jgi:uncharacterized membrane-anchored protein YhcB (DUF1043 family)